MSEAEEYKCPHCGRPDWDGHCCPTDPAPSSLAPVAGSAPTETLAQLEALCIWLRQHALHSAAWRHACEAHTHLSMAIDAWPSGSNRLCDPQSSGGPNHRTPANRRERSNDMNTNEAQQTESARADSPAVNSSVDLPHFYAYSNENPPRKLWDEDDMRDYAAAVLKQVREAIEKIVVVKGQDSGMVLLSDESPTKWDETIKVNVYEHEHFSPLGDALVALHRLIDPPNSEVTHG